MDFEYLKRLVWEQPPSAVLRAKLGTRKRAASKSLSPTSASHQKTSGTRQIGGSTQAICPQKVFCAKSCPAHGRDSAGSRLRLVLPAQYWDHSDTCRYCSAGVP